MQSVEIPPARVGLRPCRTDGVRVEFESLTVPLSDGTKTNIKVPASLFYALLLCLPANQLLIRNFIQYMYDIDVSVWRIPYRNCLFDYGLYSGYSSTELYQIGGAPVRTRGFWLHTFLGHYARRTAARR